MEKKTYRKIEREYRAGEIIFSENDRCDGLYIINSGRIRVFRNINGEEIELIQLGEKEMFGEMALIDENKRSASAAAMAPSKVTLVTREMFNDQLERLPAWVVTLIKLLVTRIRATNDKVRIMMTESETAGPVSKAQSTAEFQEQSEEAAPQTTDITEAEEKNQAGESAATPDSASAEAQTDSAAATSKINLAENKETKAETDKLLNQLDF
jgi:CRP/FNR family cyclic AMP-dependent transcriptional regulator